MTDLTEQWKKGELPEGWYYVKGNRAEGIYAYTAEYLNNMYRPRNGEIIIEQVPSYEKWQLMQDDNKRLKHDVGNLGYKIKNQRKEIERQIAQNAQLKELLKECLAHLTIGKYGTSVTPINILCDEVEEVLKC